MRRIKPDVVLSYTIKPIIYGGLAAIFCGVQRNFSMIEGLGRVFMPWESFTHALSSIIARGLYRIGLINSNHVFFLNPDDLNKFVRTGYVQKKKAVLLNGIGVDLEHYDNKELSEHSTQRFLMITRLLKDKGVREYVEAAKIVKERGQRAKFILAGNLDENPSSITQEELNLWQRDGIIDYIGYIDDVRSIIQDCHTYVLPSYYREGTPRTILEAMSMGRPIITTDSPGCRETVIDGENGYLVPIKDVDALVQTMERFILQPDLIEKMGKRSREIAEEKYDVHKVNAVILQTMGLIK